MRTEALKRVMGLFGSHRPTTYYPSADVRPWMSINRKTSALEITCSDVVAEGISWGLDGHRVRERITVLLKRLPAALDAAASDVPSTPQDLIAHVRARAAAFRVDARPAP